MEGERETRGPAAGPASPRTEAAKRGDHLTRTTGWTVIPRGRSLGRRGVGGTGERGEGREEVIAG